jgi:hypothetical protein
LHVTGAGEKGKRKKEAAERRELKKKRIKELTQGAAESRERERKELEVIHKDVMKKPNRPLRRVRRKRVGGLLERKRKNQRIPTRSYQPIQ